MLHFPLPLKFLIFLILKNFINSSVKNKYTENNNNTIGNITIKEGEYFIENLAITTTNSNNLKLNKKNKLCVINTLQDYYTNCKPFVKIFYNKWVRKKLIFIQ